MAHPQWLRAMVRLDIVGVTTYCQTICVCLLSLVSVWPQNVWNMLSQEPEIHFKFLLFFSQSEKFEVASVCNNQHRPKQKKKKSKINIVVQIQ